MTNHILNESQALISDLKAKATFLFGQEIAENMTTMSMIGGMGKDASVDDAGVAPSVNMTPGTGAKGGTGTSGYQAAQDGSQDPKSKWAETEGWYQITGINDPTKAKGWLGMNRPFYVAADGEVDLLHSDGSQMSAQDLLKTFSIERVDASSDSDNTLDSETPALLNKY